MGTRKKIFTKEELKEHKIKRDREYRKKNKKKIREYQKKWRERQPEYRKKYHKKIKAREDQRKWREKHPDYQKEYRKNIKERKLNNMSLNKSIEFLEKLKDKRGINVEMVNQMQKEVKTLDEALLLDLEELTKRLYKPIKKAWVIAIKSVNKEEIDQYEEMLTETINQGKTIFSKAMFTISLLRDESGRFKATNSKEK